MDELERIQNWYLSHCDGDWEHDFGIRIGTLDNPGWTLEVNLLDTELVGKEFATVTRGDSDEDTDWGFCKMESNKFTGAGGSKNLTELLRIFLEFAEQFV
jgi:Immunity protein 53